MFFRKFFGFKRLLVLLIFITNLFALDKLKKIDFDNNYQDMFTGVGNYQFTSYNSIELYTNESKTIFLEKIFLKNGAKVVPYAPYAFDSDNKNEYSFSKASELLNKFKKAVTVINATEFTTYKSYTFDCVKHMTCSDSTTLLYNMYINNIKIDGDKDILDKTIGMLFYIDNTKHQANIYDIDNGIKKVSDYYNKIKKENNNSSISVITGKYLDLNKNTWKKEDKKDKRTAIAIGDSDSDGIGDIIYILVAQKLTLVEVAQYFKELKVMGVNSDGTCKDEFCTDMKAMWLDSGRSSQVADRLLNANGINLNITEKRYVPSFLVVYDGIEKSLFSDIDENYWAYKYINELVKSNTIQGYPDGSFKPKNNISIGEFLKIVSSAIIKLNKNDEKNYKNNNGKMFSRYVSFLKDKNIDIELLTNNKVINSLEKNATRGYVAKVMSNSIKYFSNKKYFNSCKATNYENDWDECSIYLKKLCIVNGVLVNNKELYKPNDFISRDEISKIVSNAMHHIIKKGICND